MILTLKDIKSNREIRAMVEAANANLEALGYTDHGPRHVGYVSKIASDILRELDYPERTVELAAIAGWVHDVGNLINREGHGITGATILFPMLRELGMPIEEVCEIAAAVGSHEEKTGNPVSPISAALIIADKIDAHRARVRAGKYDMNDIHDRVNYSIKKTRVVVDKQKHEIRYEFEMDNTSSAMEFMQIYTSRMIMTELACRFLNCRFSMIVNQYLVNGHPQVINLESHGEQVASNK